MSYWRVGRRAIACVSGLSVMSLAIAASFDISGNNTTAQALNPGAGTTQTGNVTAAGDLNVSGSTVGVSITGTGTSNLNNGGKIRQTGTGRTVDNSGGSNVATINIVNNEGAVISSADADTIRVNVAGSKIALDNSGSVLSANPSKGGSQALDWNAITAAGSNLLNNYATGLIQANAADAVRPGINGVIYNAGRIEAIPALESSSGVTSASSSDGIDAQNNTGVQITNEEGGSISGRHGITGGASSSTFTVNVVNEEGATITGLNGSGINIDSNGSVMGNATVTNHGTIIGQFDSANYNTGDGDGVDVDGILELENYGDIRGDGAGGNGSDGLPNAPEAVSIGGGSITNYWGGQIIGGDLYANGNGILVDNSSGGAAFAVTTVQNEGSIRGFRGYAIRLVGDYDDIVTNAATGYIGGGAITGESSLIDMGGGNDTLVNYGLINSSSTTAINMGDGNDTVRILGGTVGGKIDGGAGSNQLIFDEGVSLCRCSILNFDSVEIRGGSVTLASNSPDYSGPMLVSGGALYTDNTIPSGGSANGTGLLTIASGAMLGGNGNLGRVTVASGGSISPGDSNIGRQLWINDTLTLYSGAHLRLNVHPSTHDVLHVGSLRIEGDGPVLLDLDIRPIEFTNKKALSFVVADFGSASGITAADFSINSAPSAYQYQLEFTGTQLVVYVAAAQAGTLRLTADTVQAKEKKGSVVFKVNRSGGVAGAISVRYQTSNGTALAGQDYEAISGTLEWADGDDSQRQVVVPVIDDMLVEGPETFTLTLSDPTGNATIGRAESVATITSDDVAGGTLQFAVVKAPVDENAGTVSVVVSRSKSSIGAIGVHYSTTNDTAIAGEDYTAVSGDLSWADGDSADKIITVPITWDSVKEKNEQFTISLSSPTGGAEIGKKPLHTVTIRNVNR